MLPWKEEHKNKGLPLLRALGFETYIDREMETTEHQDHQYTNNEDSNPVDFTYKMNREEVEEFVKLRASNDHLFSGKRYASMLAWSAILKHMGLQCKMSHYQASKKWENLKKRYKELKYPPEGVTECPKTWFLFSLMDDALHDRLQGKAPILTAPNNCSNGDFLPRCRSRKRRAPVTEITLAKDLIAGGPEIEITLSEDEDEEEEVMLEGSGLTKRCTLEVFDKQDGINHDSHELDRERALWRREKAVLDRELAALERARALLDREKATLERERAIMERERALMEKEKVILEKERDVVHSERVALEKERASLNRTSAEPARTKEETDSSGAVNSETTDRKKQLLYLFEKLLEASPIRGRHSERVTWKVWQCFTLDALPDATISEGNREQPGYEPWFRGGKAPQTSTS